MPPELFFVLDVEAIGLHGDGFAVGWCVIDEMGNERAVCYESIDSQFANGAEGDRDWIAEHVLPLLPPPTIGFEETMGHMKYWLTSETQREVVRLGMLSALRNKFWEQWIKWKQQGATLWADCAWPVESRFLAACVDENPERRGWNGPYPLHELGTALLILGYDPTAAYSRKSNELPKHHPTKDARQSARLIVATKRVLAKMAVAKQALDA